ncbi:MAG: hypothetical protein NVSMB47_02570 [Polyangiales bacterium]
MASSVRTTRRASLRVLLRGLPIPDQATRLRLHGHMVLVLGRAAASGWAEGVVQPGDVEGMIWTTAAEIQAQVAGLLGKPGIVAVRGDLGSPPPPARDRS